MAAWSSSGLVVCDAAGNQTLPVAARDGRFGTFVVWLDQRSDPDGDIYAYYINSDGSLRSSWSADGNPICSLSNIQAQPRIVSAGEGYAIVAWIDDRNGNFDIFAQRIDRDGNVLWTSNGIGVCTAGRLQAQPAMAADGNGGAYVAWSDNRNGLSNGNTLDIYALQLDATGSSPDLGTGVVICEAPNNQQEPSVVAGGEGPMFFWEDEDLQLTKFVGAQVNGLEEIGDEERELVDQTPGRLHASTSDGAGGAIVAWRYEVTNPHEFRCIRFAANGNVVTGWTNGVVATQTSTVQRPSITLDNAGGALLSWQQNSDIHVQHLESDGGVASGWAANGEVVCGLMGISQSNPKMTYDSSNGAIVCWQDLRVTASHNALFAGRIRGDKVQPWSPADGTRLITTTPVRDEKEASIVPDISGGAIVVWSNQVANNEYDIYAQRIDAEGVTASTADVVPSLGGFRIAVWPNPAIQSSVMVSFETSRETVAGIRVFDINGRVVCVLRNRGRLGAGQHSLVWDGRDSHGRRCRAGIYLLRVEGDGSESSKRLVLLN